MKNSFFKNWLLLAILLLSVSTNLFTQNVINESIAAQVGTSFLEKQTTISFPKLNLFYQSNNEKGQACFYIFNVDGGGFVIVSASKDTKPILAYSAENQFKDDMPDNVSYWLDGYRQYIEQQLEKPGAATEEVRQQWLELENGNFAKKSGKFVEPLCQTLWDQGCNYNEYCPNDWNGPCGHVYAGCVACAMSQVIKYWNYPEHGYGSHSFSYGNYGTCSADFGNTVYDWDNMPNQIWEHHDGIATLLYQCAVSVDMMWSGGGSGAYSNDVETALRKYFGYSSATYNDRSGFNEESWIALLKQDIDNQMPLYYSGSSGSGGHAFVCDGYDNNNYFHFNWGWSGSGNGYYSLDDVMGFNNGQAVVSNIRPLPINSDENGIIYVSTDGEGDGSSWENATSYLEYAISRASDNSKQVWVKSGVYYGDTISPNGAYEILAQNRIYGGFAGNEAPNFNLDNRDFETNPTILDGQGQHRVLYQANYFTNGDYAVWDGFTLQNGNSGSGSGAFLYANTRLRNCKIINNVTNGFGGGVCINSSAVENATVKIENCIIRDNVASMGGGICDRFGITASNCVISNNTATTKGGGLYIYLNIYPKFMNCIIDNNSANLGGACYSRGKMTVINCDIVKNQASESYGGVFNETDKNKFYNTIIWGNESNGTPNQIFGSSRFEYCAVQGGIEGTENINLADENYGTSSDMYVGFMNPEENDWRLAEVSACYNRGNNSVSGLPNTDILGNQRIYEGVIDIGAVEFQSYTSIDEDMNFDFSIYPNPTDHLLFIKGNFNQAFIYNSAGQLMTTIDSQNDCNIDVKDWNRGIYFVKIISGKQTSTKKVIVY